MPAGLGEGCEDAIDLMMRLPDHFHLALVGDGPLRQELEKRAKLARLIGRIHFLGTLDDIGGAYTMMDGLLFMSKHETFGLILLEAMAAGVPVIGLAGEGGYRDPQYPATTTRNSVLLERSGVNLPATPELLNELAHQVSELFNNPSRIAQITSEADAWARTRFAAEIQCSETLSVYEQLLARDAS